MEKKVKTESADDLTVNAEWVQFSRSIFSKVEPSTVQYEQTKLAFYAGVFTMQTLNLRISREPSSIGVRTLHRLMKECERFIETYAFSKKTSQPASPNPPRPAS